MKKKQILVIVVCVACIAVIGSLTAYLGDNQTAENKIIIAKDEITVTENFPDSNVEQEKEKYTIYRKEVKIANTGNIPCYIRVYAALPDDDSTKDAYFSRDGADYYSAVRDTSKSSDDTGYPKTVAAADINKADDYELEDGINIKLHSQSFVNKYCGSSDDWVFIPDSDISKLAGYYYYTKPINAGKSTTTPLFTNVLLDNSSASKTLSTINLIVYAESIQTYDMSGNEYVKNGDIPAWKVAWTDYLT